MERLPKSAAISGLLLAALAGLAGCYSSNEVPQNVLDEPRAVSPPPPASNPSWPRLGDVPSKPKDFPPPAAVDQAKQQMESDRAEGQALHGQYENQPGAPQ